MLLHCNLIAFTIQKKNPLLIISELRTMKFCPNFKIIYRRWILSQGNRGCKNQSVRKTGNIITK